MAWLKRRGSKLYIEYATPGTKHIKRISTGLEVGQKRQAQQVLAEWERLQVGGVETPAAAEVLTVEAWGAQWLEERKARGKLDWINEQGPLQPDRPALAAHVRRRPVRSRRTRCEAEGEPRTSDAAWGCRGRVRVQWNGYTRGQAEPDSSEITSDYKLLAHGRNGGRARESKPSIGGREASVRVWPQRQRARNDKLSARER